MRLARMGARRVALAAVAFVALGFCAIGCKKSGSDKADAGDASVLEVGGNTDVMPDRPDGSEVGPACITGTRAIADACTCDKQCASGACTDGVCCDMACKEGCKTCNAPGSVGTCVNRSSGELPRSNSNTCVMSAASTCGLDGTCDGTGGCRKYPASTMCKSGSCDGDAVVGSYACDGAGHCKPGPTRICVPFSCNPSTG